MMLFSLPDPSPVLREGRVYLRLPMVVDYEAWADERGASADFLKPWEPSWSPDDLTRPAFRRRVARVRRECRERHGYGFLMFRDADDQLLGGATLSNIRFGVARSCSLGYWMSRRHAGNGYMREGVEAMVRFAFDDLGLHRVEASCIPHNERSLRLLVRSGFVHEGYARSYLLIDGAWRDHLLFARVNGG